MPADTGFVVLCESMTNLLGDPSWKILYASTALSSGICRRTRIHVRVDSGDAHGSRWLDHFHQCVDDGFLHVLRAAFRPIPMALEADTIDGGVDPPRAGAEDCLYLIWDGRGVLMDLRPHSRTP